MIPSKHPTLDDTQITKADILAALRDDPVLVPQQPGEYTLRELCEALDISLSSLGKRLESDLGKRYERRRGLVHGKLCWLWRLKE